MQCRLIRSKEASPRPSKSVSQRIRVTRHCRHHDRGRQTVSSVALDARKMLLRLVDIRETAKLLSHESSLQKHLCLLVVVCEFFSSLLSPACETRRSDRETRRGGEIFLLKNSHSMFEAVRSSLCLTATYIPKHVFLKSSSMHLQPHLSSLQRAHISCTVLIYNIPTFLYYLTVYLREPACNFILFLSLRVLDIYVSHLQHDSSLFAMCSPSMYRI